MAANRIKGITIEIDGNTSKLADSLKDVNKTIKDTQSELRDVEKLLKMDPKNLDLLAQKQELLGKATEGTKEKLEKLKQAQEQMKTNGVDVTSAEYRALSREIADCEQEMEKLEKASLETDKAIIRVASGADKVADATGKMSKATSGLSKAAGGALGGLAGLGIKAAKDADDLNTLAKQTGLSTESLQKMQYASDLIDVNVDDITGSFTRMKKQLDSGEEKFESIGVHTKDMNGNLRDSETVFYETIQALGQIENETERDTKAMEIFGKSADELAGLIDDGGEAFKRLGDEAKANGNIISQEELDKANELNDTLDKLKAEMGSSFAQVGISIAQALAPVIEAIVPVLQKVADFIKELNPETIKIVAIILAIVAALSPLLGLISAVAAAVPTIIAVVGALFSPLGAVIALVGAIIAVGVLVIKHWDDIKAKMAELGESLAQGWENIKSKASETWDSLKTIATEKWNSIKDTFKQGIENIKNWWNNMKFSIPKIKLPHFKVSGSLDLLNIPPKIPSVSIDWYKKAYDDAYLLNSPTIFGASGGSLLGGGEGNGSEAVVGTDKLMSMMSDVVGNQNVTVVLEGDAQGVFNLVRVENSRFMKSNGYSPLMG